jgi:hypothetical protein
MADPRFAGLKVLFVAPRLFHYHTEIADELATLGARVDFGVDRPPHTTLGKAVIRFDRRLLQPWSDAHFARSIDWDADYDVVFVLIGEALSPAMLRRMRARFTHGKFVLFMWDSFGNKPALRAHLPFFDRAFSSNPDDVAAHGLHYRPLFASRRYETLASDRIDYELSFVGTAHGQRFPLVRAIIDAAGARDRSYTYFYLQSPAFYFARRWTDPALAGARFGDFRYAAMPADESADVLARSRAVIDMPHPLQEGLTIRTFESLAAGRKLITTNPLVKTLDLYRTGNILWVDPADVRVPADFLATPFNPIPTEMFAPYTLREWLAGVFDV